MISTATPAVVTPTVGAAVAVGGDARTAAITATTPASNSSNASSSDIVATGSRDTTYTKIFVGGLPYHTTDMSLNEYFSQFGEIDEAVVITDRQTQKSRGYGFVTMKERADAEKACKDPNPIIDGRKANVNLAYLGAKPRNNVHLAVVMCYAPTSNCRRPSNNFQPVFLKCTVDLALSTTGLHQLPSLPPFQSALFPATAVATPANAAAAAAAAAAAGRIGIPQLYFPNAMMQNALLANVSAANNPLAQFQPAAVAAAVAAAQQQAAATAAQQQLAAVSQTGLMPTPTALYQQQFGAATPQQAAFQLQQQAAQQQATQLQMAQAQQPQIDYAAFAAAAAAAASAQNGANGFSAALPQGGLEQYGYHLGMLGGPGVGANNAYAAQLSAAQAQLAVAASGSGHSTLDNQRV